jgi:hypothetical protein
VKILFKRWTSLACLGLGLVIFNGCNSEETPPESSIPQNQGAPKGPPGGMTPAPSTPAPIGTPSAAPGDKTDAKKDEVAKPDDTKKADEPKKDAMPKEKEKEAAPK